jgi:TPR repeat protein
VDPVTRQQLIDATEAFHKEDNWSAVEALWRPYVEQGDLEAEFRLAYYYLFYSFDEEGEVRAEMVDLLRTAADRGHADAVYFLSHLCPQGQERDALLLKAGELGSLKAQRDLGAYYATGNWTGPKDLAQAVQWYRRAAERGHSERSVQSRIHVRLGRWRSKRSRRRFAVAPPRRCPRIGRRDAPDRGSLSRWPPWSANCPFASGGLGSAILRV